MNRTICDAIKSMRTLKFDYGGGTRIVEPHCYGVSRKGNELLRAYQTSGYSESGETEGWKLFSVEEISSVQFGANEFSGPRPQYNSRDRAMASIYCAL